MGKKKSIKKAGISDYLTYAVYRIVESTLRLLPMEIVCVIGSALGQIAYFLMGRRRDIVIRNLRIAYGEQLGVAEIKALARKTYRHSGLNLIASIPASVIADNELKERVAVEGLDNLIKVLNQDKGCILLLAHMGNWEILTQLKVLAPEIKSLASLYRPLNNPLLDRLVKRRRQSKGAILFSRRDSFAKPIGHLKQGGTLGCIADQHAGSHGAAVPLFGKASSMTSLPALLHRKTKAPILPISMITVGLGQWKVIFHPSINVSAVEKKNTYLLTARCAKAYERIMSENPAAVLWMHGYWKVGRRRPLHIDGLQKRTLPRPFSQPFRILVYTGEFTGDHVEAAGQLARLKAYRPDIHITTVGEHLMSPITDHHIACDSSSPPHLIYNAIRAHDLELDAPLDCAIDFTEDGSGGKLCSRSGMDRVFCRTGKWMSEHTQAVFKEQNGNSIALLLTSLGLDNETVSN